MEEEFNISKEGNIENLEVEGNISKVTVEFKKEITLTELKQKLIEDMYNRKNYDTIDIEILRLLLKED